VSPLPYLAYYSSSRVLPVQVVEWEVGKGPNPKEISQLVVSDPCYLLSLILVKLAHDGVART
jgi:hypothetical protein